MKSNNLKDLRKKDFEELRKIAGEKRVEKQNAKAAIKVGSEKNLKKVRHLKKELSQLLTVIREKEIIEKVNKQNKKSKKKKGSKK
jgi:ribosomal protein L29